MSNLDAFEHKKPNAYEAERAHVENTPSEELDRLVRARHGTAERAVSEESLDNERKLLREQIAEKRERANRLENDKKTEIIRERSPGLYVLEDNKDNVIAARKRSPSLYGVNFRASAIKGSHNDIDTLRERAIVIELDKQIADLRASASAYEKDFEAVVAARAQFGYADRIHRERDASENPLAA